MLMSPQSIFNQLLSSIVLSDQPSNVTLKASWFKTPLGPMIAVADNQSLHLLEFFDRRKLSWIINRLQMKMLIMPGRTNPIDQVEHELGLYFKGTLNAFQTPLALGGTPFQKQVWNALQQIPFGHTHSYQRVAEKIGNPSAFRAVAQANGANQCAIIVPCHRVINKNNALGGYGAGLVRKEWLIRHEKSCLFFLNR